jgi:hypothetical protein
MRFRNKIDPSTADNFPQQPKKHETHLKLLPTLPQCTGLSNTTSTSSPSTPHTLHIPSSLLSDGEEGGACDAEGCYGVGEARVRFWVRVKVRLGRAKMRQRGLVGDGWPVGRLLGCEKGVALVVGM